MKKIILVLGLFLVMISTSACHKLAYQFDIDKEGNLSISETQAINLNAMSDFMANMTKGMTQTPKEAEVKEQIAKSFEKNKEETRKELETEGYEVEDYNDGTFNGLTKTKNYNINNFKLSNLPKGFIVESRPFVLIKEETTGKTYSIDMKYDFSVAADDTQAGKQRYSPAIKNQQPLSPSTEKAMEAFLPTAELTIKTPTKATKHNATEVINENEYKWKLALDSPTKIELEYKIADYSTIMIIFSLVFLGIFLLVAYNKLKNDG